MKVAGRVVFKKKKNGRVVFLKKSSLKKKKSSWQRKQPVQRPWGERMTIVFKERQGNQCDWSRWREEKSGRRCLRGNGQDLVVHSERFGFYSERDESHGGILSRGRTGLTYVVKISPAALWRMHYGEPKAQARSPERWLRPRW